MNRDELIEHQRQEIKALKAANLDLQIHFDILKAELDEVKSSNLIVSPSLFSQTIGWIEDRRRYGDDGTLYQVWIDLKTLQQNWRSAGK